MYAYIPYMECMGVVLNTPTLRPDAERSGFEPPSDRLETGRLSPIESPGVQKRLSSRRGRSYVRSILVSSNGLHRP